MVVQVAPMTYVMSHRLVKLVTRLDFWVWIIIILRSLEFSGHFGFGSNWVHVVTLSDIIEFGYSGHDNFF